MPKAVEGGRYARPVCPRRGVVEDGPCRPVPDGAAEVNEGIRHQGACLKSNSVGARQKRASLIVARHRPRLAVFKITASSKSPRAASPVRENAMAPQCPSSAANKPAIRIACSALRASFGSHATMSPLSSDRLKASATK